MGAKETMTPESGLRPQPQGPLLGCSTSLLLRDGASLSHPAQLSLCQDSIPTQVLPSPEQSAASGDPNGL